MRRVLSLSLLATVVLAACDEPSTVAPADTPVLVGGTASLTLAQPRISEIHYDNTGTDTGEFVELSAPAGTDLTGWSVVLYNGNGGSSYNTLAIADAGVSGGTCGGQATDLYLFDLPSNGLQNGSPDGLALVDAGGAVVEFLSYEGTFTASGGPADGLTSEDIGVAEPGDTPVGFSLERRADGSWEGADASTPGSCNLTGTGPGDGDGGGDGDGDGDGDGGGDSPGFFIGALHYDNEGGDVGEGFAIGGAPGAALDGWSVVRYNGSNGEVYGTTDLSGAEIGVCAEGPRAVFTLPSNGLQNGAPDGLALVDPSGGVAEFISYEGSFTAVGGPADGLTSTDIGVQQGSDTPVGASLKRVGDVWRAFDGTGDFPLEGITCSPPPPVFLSELRLDQPGGDDDEYFEVAGSAGAALDGVTLLVLGDGSGGFGVIEEVESLDGFALDAAGAFVASDGDFGLGTADATLSLDFENGGNPTILLVRGFTGSNGDDLDAEDDGVLDVTPWVEVVDCLSLVGGALGDQPIYCDQRVGLDASFTPGHPKRLDTGWESAVFTTGIDDTPGTIEFDVTTAAPGVIAPWGVQPPGVPTRITASASRVELPVGFRRALFVTLRDDFGDQVEGVPLTFTVNDASVAGTDVFGNVEALGIGETDLVIAAEGLDISTTVDLDVVADAPSGVVFQNHIEFGAPRDGDESDDIRVERDEFIASYNPIRNASNWVAWNLEDSHIGDVDRCECYTFDPLLPGGLTEVVNFDYTGSGYSRGHMAQSFNRTATLPDNAATYWLTNILPQSSANNGGPWGDFEFYTNGRVFGGEEAYLVAGGIWGDAPTTLKGEGRVQIPDYTWKVAVFLPKDGTLADVKSVDDLEVIAIVTPNRTENGVPGGIDEITSNDWEDYVVEVDEIERRTGYDVLSLLAPEIEGRIETGLDDVFEVFDAAVEAGSISRWPAFFLGLDLNGAAKLFGLERDRFGKVALKIFLGKLDLYERRGWVPAEVAADLRAETEEVLATVGG
jgi:DNA/RNA endonuclease G (NUC1)